MIGAFEGCSSLTSITIPNSVTSIGIWAFKSCSSLSIAIPNSITSICYCAFSYCSSLTDVYYGGSEERWNSINISVNNYYLTDATIHYNSSEIPTGQKEIQILHRTVHRLSNRCMSRTAVTITI